MIQIVTSSRYLVNRKRVRAVCSEFYQSHAIAGDTNLHIVFVGKLKMRQIAKTYKHEDVALPVLAFPYRNDTTLTETLLGEIVICYPQVVLLAVEKNKRFDTVMDELLIHALNNLIKEY